MIFRYVQKLNLYALVGNSLCKSECKYVCVGKILVKFDKF